MQGAAVFSILLCVVGVLGKPKVLVLVDPFTSYLSGHCKSWCERNDVRVIEAVSPYQVAILGAEGRSVPDMLRAPDVGEEHEWCEERGIVSGGIIDDDVDSDNDDEVPSIEDVYVLSESEVGIGTAERIQIAIGAPGNGHCPQLYDKFEQNRRCQNAGLSTNKQFLASTWEEAAKFFDEELWKKKSSGSSSSQARATAGEKSLRRNRKQSDSCIMKPNRGVASDGVYLCHSLQEASAAFKAIKRAATFGEVHEKNPHVLIQEYTPGSEEYAVDTVTCQGVTRVAALWKYDKIKANGSPFIYQSTELVDVDCENQRDALVRRKVVDYAVKALQAQNLRYGACHVEIKVHPRLEQPRLMEVNARWHAQPFLPIMTQALGYDSLELTMEALFEPERFMAAVKELRSRPLGTKASSRAAPSEEGGYQYPSTQKARSQGKDKDRDRDRDRDSHDHHHHHDHHHDHHRNHAPPRKTGAGAIVHLVQRAAGKVTAINVEAVEALPSVQSVSIDVQVGDEVGLTVDHRTHSGCVVMYSHDEAAFRRDYRRLLDLQDHIVEVEVEQEQEAEAPANKSKRRREEKRSKGGRGAPRLGLGRPNTNTSSSGKAAHGAQRQSAGAGAGRGTEGRGLAEDGGALAKATATAMDTDRDRDRDRTGTGRRLLNLIPRPARLMRMAKIAAVTSSVAYAAAAAYITFLPEYES